MVIILIMIALIIIDQAVKYWAIVDLEPIGSMDFIKFGDFKILDLTYLENDGAIFGSMAGRRWFLVGFTLLVIVALIVYLFRNKRNSKFLNASIILYAAGGIGNLIDRIRFGYVVDMFEIKLFRFAIFNVADIYVTLAVIFIAIYMIFIDNKTKKAATDD
jgi:signal peptidase II